MSMGVTRAVSRYRSRVLFVVGCLCAVSGCSNQLFRQRQAIRSERIEHHLSRFAAHEAAGCDRAGRTIDRLETAADYRAEHLGRTAAMIHNGHERRVERWESQAARRRAFFARQFRGNPEQIDETFAKMFY